jgi:hypothetical protein
VILGPRAPTAVVNSRWIAGPARAKRTGLRAVSAWAE